MCKSTLSVTHSTQTKIDYTSKDRLQGSRSRFLLDSLTDVEIVSSPRGLYHILILSILLFEYFLLS